MRIIFFSNYYPPTTLGGYEMWCSEVANELVGRNYQVAVVTSAPQDIPSHMNENGIQVHRILHNEVVGGVIDTIKRFIFQRDQMEAENLKSTRQIIADFAPDFAVIWGMWNIPRSVPHLVEQLLPGRVGYYICDYWVTLPSAYLQKFTAPSKSSFTTIPKYMLRRPLEMLALSRLRKEGYPPNLRFENAFCCSQYVRDRLVDGRNLPESTKIIYGGVDTDSLYRKIDQITPSTNDPVKMIYFGRLISDKGVHLAIEALGILLNRRLTGQFHLTILGDGHPDYIRMLKMRILDLNLDKYIHFENWIPRNKIPNWIKNFDIYLFTSTWPEPWGRTVMEAMAAGLLVIGSEVGGTTEMLVNNENCLTFPAGNSEYLANQIQYVIENPSIMVKLATAGQDMILEKFQLKRMIDDFEEKLLDLYS